MGLNLRNINFSLAEKLCLYFGSANNGIAICPACRSHAKFFRYSMSCSSPSCDFFAADIFHISKFFNDESFSVLNKFAAENNLEKFDTDNLRTLSHLLEIYNDLRKNSSPSVIGSCLLSDNNGWTYEGSWSAAPASAKGVRHLLSALENAGALRCYSKAAATGGIIIPAWIEPGLIGGFVSVGASKTTAFHRVTDYSLWTGAVNAAHSEKARLLSNALSAAEQCAKHVPSVWYQPGFGVFWRPEKIICDPLTVEDFAAASAVYAAGCSVFIGDKPWEQEASKKFIALAAKNIISPEKISACGFTANIAHDTVKLAAGQNERLAKTIVSAVSFLPVFVSRHGELCASETGYKWRKPNGPAFPVCDFTIRPVESVVFDNTTDCYRKFSVSSKFGSWEIISRLDDAASGRTAVKVLSSKTFPPLEIYDANAYTKFVGAYLRSPVERIPIVKGIDKFGWSENKTTFNGAGWVCAKDKIETGLPLKPDSAFSGCFEPVEISSAMPDAAGINKGAKTIIELCCGMVSKTFRGVQTHPVFLPADRARRKDITALFAGLGQKSVAHIKYKGITEQDDWRGHPFFAQGLTQNQASKYNAPAVILSDTGLNIEPLTNGGDYAELFRSAFLYAIKNILSGADTARKRADYASSLIAEGKAALKNYPGWDAAEEKYDVFEEFLESRPEFVYNFEKQKIYFTVKEPFNAEKIAQNLSEKNIEPEQDENTISIPAVSGMAALQAFYGDTTGIVRIVMPEKFLVENNRGVSVKV